MVLLFFVSKCMNVYLYMERIPAMALRLLVK